MVALLAHLGIANVTLACNSGGLIYAFNLLLHRRQLLHPTHPYLGVFAPWVHQSHTSTIISAVDFLPRAAIGNLHNVLSFVNKRVAPVFGWSSGVVASVLPSDDAPTVDGGSGKKSKRAGDCGKELGYGEDEAVVEMSEEQNKAETLRWQHIMKYVFAEEIAGASDDALLLVKRTGAAQPWGSWGDFDTAVPLLAEQEAALERLPGAKPLRVEAFYAESDRMIGKSGAEWFSKCFSEEKRGEIGFEAWTWPETDHDGILSRRFGLLERWIREVKKMYEDD